MFALTLGSRDCSGRKSSRALVCIGRKSSRVLVVEMFVVRCFEDLKKAVGFGGVHCIPFTGFGSLLSSLVNLVRISSTSHR